MPSIWSVNCTPEPRERNQELNNFRPISLLSIFDKIIEKLMHKRLYEFFEENNILYGLQFSFRKKMSTGHSLVEITEEIKESIDNGKFLLI